MLNASVGN